MASSEEQAPVLAGLRPNRIVAFYRHPLTEAFLADKITVVSAFVVLVVVVCAVFAEFVSPHDPDRAELKLRHLPPFSSDSERMGDKAEGRYFILGTDEIGRDMTSRLIHGARVSLIIAVSGVSLATVTGAALGLVSGYFRGVLDDLIMRVVDVFMTLPFLLFALLVIYILGTSVINVILVFGITGWTGYARITRGLVLSLREQPFVDAARALGCTDSWIIVKHILPNVLTTLFTLSALAIPGIILGEAALSFLGFGIQPPQSSWGLMLAKGRIYIQSAWWVVAFPGFAIFITVLCVNLAGIWVRAVTDPVQRWRWLKIPKEFSG